MPTFMGLPAAPLANGIPAGDLVIPAPRSETVDREASGREILLPPRRRRGDDLRRTGPWTPIRPPSPRPSDRSRPSSPTSNIPESAAPSRLRQATLAGDPAAAFELASRLGRRPRRRPRSAARRRTVSSGSPSAGGGHRSGAIPDRADLRQGRRTPPCRAIRRRPSAGTGARRRAATSPPMTTNPRGSARPRARSAGEPDYTGAIGWFRRAAEHGVRDSQYNLAVLLARGLGTPQDLSASYHLVRHRRGPGRRGRRRTPRRAGEPPLRERSRARRGRRGGLAAGNALGGTRTRLRLTGAWVERSLREPFPPPRAGSAEPRELSRARPHQRHRRAAGTGGRSPSRGRRLIVLRHARGPPPGPRVRPCSSNLPVAEMPVSLFLILGLGAAVGFISGPVRDRRRLPDDAAPDLPRHTAGGRGGDPDRADRRLLDDERPRGAQGRRALDVKLGPPPRPLPPAPPRPAPPPAPPAAPPSPLPLVLR